MFFQHYITDDFIRHQSLLSKKISVESMNELLAATGEPFYIFEMPDEDNNPIYAIDIAKPNHLLILGKSFNKSDRIKKYNSIKTWLSEDGFPVVCNVKALREEYTNLSMMNDRLLCLFVYACEHKLASVLELLDIRSGEDIIELFCRGFSEYGVRSEFEGYDKVPSSKLRYLIAQGRRMEVNSDER